ncbi:MAG: hypothetical protein ACPGNP_01395, partial [Acidimicrobiales bacterium]
IDRLTGNVENRCVTCIARPEFRLDSHQASALDLHSGIPQQPHEIAVAVDGGVQLHCGICGVNLKRNQDLPGHFATHDDLVCRHTVRAQRTHAFAGPPGASFGEKFRIGHLRSD